MNSEFDNMYQSKYLFFDVIQMYCVYFIGRTIAYIEYHRQKEYISKREKDGVRCLRILNICTSNQTCMLDDN